MAHEAGLTSKAGSSGGFQTNGLAILDTGASRSVIGEDNIPSLMEQLPKPVRSRVKEKASHVAFRFGNNQIEYSYKQLHIPIKAQTHSHVVDRRSRSEGNSVFAVNRNDETSWNNHIFGKEFMFLESIR